MIRVTQRLALILVLATLAACGQEGPQKPEPTPVTSEAPRSIFRPGFDAKSMDEDKGAAPLDRRIAFPDGAELTDAAKQQLAAVLAAPQMASGGAIVLRGHSDAGGTDTANMRASQARAEAVRNWLIEHGVDAGRITIIAFGEQNPAAPNARPDGTADPEGRAINRRVEVHIASAAPDAPADQPTLAEELADPAADVAKGQ